MARFSMLLLVSVFAVLALAPARAGTEAERPLPAPAFDMQAAKTAPQTAVLAGGCFWGMQGAFQHVKGVTAVLAGYSGGTKETAKYDIVSSHTTGHAEAVQITFDPSQISYGQILRIFFSIHDPTQLNYQGPDEGANYRSEIFYTSKEQQKIAAAYVAQLAKAHAFDAPIVTQLGALKAFYPAEDYHQDYLIHHPEEPYIAVNDLPKIAALKKLYPALYRQAPVMVFPKRASL